jgi:hypothetical protein
MSSSEVKEVGLSWAATDDTQRKMTVRAMSVLFMNAACLFVGCDEV